MSSYYYLKREAPKKASQIIPLGAFTGNTFYPTMAYDVFEILVRETDFIIQDESGNVFTFDSFQETISNSFSNNPPVISLGAS